MEDQQQQPQSQDEADAAARQAEFEKDPRPVLQAVVKVKVTLKDPDGLWEDEIPVGFKNPRTLLSASQQMLVKILRDGGMWRILDEYGLKRNWVPMTRIKEVDFEVVVPMVSLADGPDIAAATKKRVSKEEVAQATKAASGLHLVG